MLRAIYTIILFLRDFVPLLTSVPSWKPAIVGDVAAKTIVLLSASLLLATYECEHLNLSILQVLRPRPY